MLHRDNHIHQKIESVMQSLDLQNKINTLMSMFVTQVKGATSMGGKTDINKNAETVLMPLFKEIYGYTNLKNLNTTEQANYPAIDLGDEIAKVAIQVTSTTDSEKIKNTLRGFAEYKLYEKFDRLIIYILTEKQKTYSGRGYQNIIQGKFSFNQRKDIQDYRNLLSRISDFQIDKLRKIFNILEANFGEGKTPLFLEATPEKLETIYLNLLELFFPEKLYMADIALNREKVITKSKDYKLKLKKNASTRDIIRAALEQAGLAFGVDWVDYDGKLVTFHDLRNVNLPLSAIINSQSITSLNSQDFYEIDSARENVFKSLLGRCLQQKLYPQQVIWQNQKKLFIFSDINGAAIRIEKWYGKRKSDRVVYERIMKNNKPNEILRCKHFAFRTRYLRFGNNWYLSITPDWFFSFDGYRHSRYAQDNLNWLKRHENDRSVYNHLRFIAAFLKIEKTSDLFTARHRYPFLSFGELVTCDNAPSLNDNEWNPKKPKNDIVNTQKWQQLELSLKI